jgi:hypothetical protein
MEIHGTEVR